MANLNIPFVILQPSQCTFKPTIETSKLISYNKYNLRNPSKPDYQDVYQTWLKEEFKNHDPNPNDFMEFAPLQYQRFSDMTPKNLVVLGDSESGVIALCHQEWFVSKKKDGGPESKTKRINKFVVMLQPRVLLVPSISEEVGPVRDHCLVRSPAQHVLSTSSHFLVTLHNDNRIRLWNTNDGRCVMTSQHDMLVTVGKKLRKIKTHPGHIMVLGDKGDIYIINLYTMSLLSHFAEEFTGVSFTLYKSKTFVLCDNDGKMFIWRDDSAPSPLNTVNQTVNNAVKHNSLLLESCNIEEQERFKFQLTSVIGGIDKFQSNEISNEANDQQILAIHFSSIEQIIQVHSSGIDYYIKSVKNTLHQFNGNNQKLIFAKFFTAEKRKLLLCVDVEFKVTIYDTLKLKNESTSKEPIFVANLFDDCTKFDLCEIKNDELLKDKMFGSLQENKERQIKTIKHLITEQQQNNQQEKVFKFNSNQKLLFTIIQKNQKSQMVTWCIQSIVENLSLSLDYKNTKIPLFVNTIQLFPKQKQNCLIHFQSILSRNYYSQHQFQFFFSDEIITEQVTYTSTDHPCLIIGTNYGRIFMVPLFQEQEGKVLPVVLLDSHQQAPITQLFIAYNSSRKFTHQQQGSSKSSFSHHHQVSNEYERGGHLISVSANGTIAVTILNSGEIEMALHSVQPTLVEKDKRRAQQFMEVKAKNKKQRRRNSLQQDFSIHYYFHMVKARSHKIYPYTSFDAITQVIEVLSVQELHEKIISKRSTTRTQRRGHSPEFKQNMGGLQNKMGSRRGSAENLLGHEDLHALDYPSYACLSKDGMVFVLKLSNVHSELVVIQSLDSKAIGVYQDLDNEQLLVLTEKLTLFIYNDKAGTLERKADFKMAINMLYVRETVEYLMSMNESFKLLPKNDTNVIDFYSFEKIFQKKSLLMGHGSHKILDFLTLSLNHPLNYHPHSIYSTKYTKVMHDLLLNKTHFHDFNKQDESSKMVLRILNSAYFQNNRFYKSDYNNDYFMKQTGVTTLGTNLTFCGTKQQLIIINTKQMIAIMKQKMHRVSNYLNNNSRKASNQYSEDGENYINEKPQSSSPMNGSRNPSFKRESTYRKGHSRNPDSLVGIKWPTRLLSLVYPFNLDENIDQQVEQQFGLSLPFLDFRIGIQGTEESFAFIISKEDENFHMDKKKAGKILNLLKMSRAMSETQPQSNIDVNNNQGNYKINNSLSILSPQQLPNEEEQDYIEPVGVFFNSEYWKISSYLSTIMPVFMFSTFVAITEYSQLDAMKFLIQEQLYSLQKINQQKTPENANQLSMSVISKLLLKKDADISSTTRDIILKPLMYILDDDYLKVLMKEWQDIIIDTYKRLKKESLKKKANQQQNQHALNRQDSFSQTNQVQNEQKHINYYFGEIEIRGLINLSQYSLHHPKIMDKQIQYRISKLTTILTKEIVEKFYVNKKYIYLLTALLQQLSTWIKSQDRSSKEKNVIQETIKLLLYLFSYYKESLNKSQFILKITGENFHLIRPNKADLYLKLTSAKTLMEIGEYQTSNFLNIIQEQALNINDGLEYQQNVLEILRFFINSQGESLEHHLIHLTQIFIKCLDPNELVLRKNSHKLIAAILSRMVLIFPMVAFHHESQRLAIGTTDGFIAIYDVRTSAKYKILEKHEGNVTCMAFESKGNLLASYSAVDATIKLWKVGNTGFFSTIMGGTSKPSKEIKLDRLDRSLNPHQIIQTNKQNQLNGQVKASQNAGDLGGNGTIVNKCSIKFLLPKEKDVVLVREDGSVYTSKLAK